MATSKAHEVARQWMKDNPDTPNRTIARHLHELRPRLYPTIERARSIVRSIAGQNGDVKRKQIADKGMFKPAGKQADTKIVIPEGVSEFKAPIEISGPCKVLIMGDLHIPYHDKRAIEVAINEGLKQGCDTLYLNGDIGDFYAASRFDKDPENRSLDQELETIEEVLEAMAPHFKRKYFKCGNHDDRWQLYLWRNAPALGRVAKMRLDAVLELKEKGYEWVHTKQWAQIGALPVLHGHELQGGSAVNPARGAYLKVTNTIAVNHHHRTSQHVETQSLSQEQIVTWSIGCMCDMRPNYNPLGKWNLGFGILSVDKSGEFNMQNLRIDHTRGYKVYR